MDTVTLLSMFISMMVFAFAMLGIVIFCFNDIKFRFQAIAAKKKGLGLIAIIGNNFRMKYYWRKLTDIVTVGNDTYLIKPKFKIDQRGIPTYYYYDGDAVPIDMLKRGRDLLSPELFGDALIKAKQSGSISKENKRDIMFYLTIGACLGGLAAAGMSFQILDMLGKNLPTIIAKCAGA